MPTSASKNANVRAIIASTICSSRVHKKKAETKRAAQAGSGVASSDHEEVAAGKSQFTAWTSGFQTARLAHKLQGLPERAQQRQAKKLLQEAGYKASPSL